MNHNDFYKERIIICDLDGTLSLFEKEDKTQPHYRNPYNASTCENDLVNPAVKLILDNYDYGIIFVSGREDKYRLETYKWLDKHGWISIIFEVWMF